MRCRRVPHPTINLSHFRSGQTLKRNPKRAIGSRAWGPKRDCGTGAWRPLAPSHPRILEHVPHSDSTAIGGLALRAWVAAVAFFIRLRRTRRAAGPCQRYENVAPVPILQQLLRSSKCGRAPAFAFEASYDFPLAGNVTLTFGNVSLGLLDVSARHHLFHAMPTNQDKKGRSLIRKGSHSMGTPSAGSIDSAWGPGCVSGYATRTRCPASGEHGAAVSFHRDRGLTLQWGGFVPRTTHPARKMPVQLI
jgi:hypothetical protein